MRPYNGALITVLMLISACGTLPYREDFACALQDDYGKCIDVEGAYLEAVTGADSGAPRLSPDGKAVEPLQSSANQMAGPMAAVDVQGSTSSPNADAYGAYRAALYQEMQSLLAQPATPVVRAPRTVRTLILSYQDRDDKKRLYMPRYVFSIVEGPSFVLGQYLDRRAELLPATIVTISQDDLAKDNH